MGGGEELDFGEDFLERRNDLALPFGVQVQVDLVDEDEAGGVEKRVFLEAASVKDAHAPGKVGEQTDNCSLTIAHFGKPLLTTVAISQDDLANPAAVFDMFRSFDTGSDSSGNKVEEIAVIGIGVASALVEISGIPLIFGKRFVAEPLCQGIAFQTGVRPTP